ncbi:MAG TPA: exosortase [Bryobacteraceae bacterium]|nr:exosortase [Bryobacteraceae bacterium]
MRIVFLNQAFYPDVVSTAQHAADLAAHLAAEGHEVYAIASERAYDDPSKTFPREETWKGVRIKRIPSGNFGKGARWRRALDFAIFLICLSWQLIRLPRFDTVVAFTTPPLIGFVAALFVKIKGGRLLYWVMDLNPDQAIAAGWLKPDSTFARMFGWMLRFTLRHASRIVALDRFMVDRILQKHADRNLIDIVPPWSHDAAVQFDEVARESFRREHGLTGKFVVMHSGNHSPCHPLQSLLEAANRIRSRDDIVFCFVGGGSELGRVKRFAEENGLTNIKCLPYQPMERLSGSLGAADLHVVVMGDPFVGIVHPCKIYNVLLLGTPVLYIGPEAGHVPDMVPHEAYSKWFYNAEHGQVDRIMEQVLTAASHPRLRDEEEQRIGAGFSATVLVKKASESIHSLSPRAVETAASLSGHSIPWRFLSVAAALILCYAVVLVRLAKAWVTDDNMNHGFFVPFLVGYAVWQERDALRKTVPASNAFGLFFMLVAGVLLCMGPPKLDTFAFATRIAFVLSLLGSIIFLRGFATVRVLLYPLLLMLLMIPLPGFVVERITFPLQILASQLAERSLDLLGYSVLREGNILRMPQATLSIVDACSGLRSLLSLTFLGQAYVCMFDGRRWMRLVMALLVIPIAVFANSMRIVVNAIGATYSPTILHGILHESTGWVAFVVAFACIVLFHASFGRIGRIVRRETAA